MVSSRLSRFLPGFTSFKASSKASSPVATPSSPVTTTAAVAKPAAMSTSSTTATTTNAAGETATNQLLDVIQVRRSIYQLTKDLPIPAARVQDIVQQAVKHVPSSFNAQTTRTVILFGAEHEQLWDIAAETLRAILPKEQYDGYTGPKIAGFRAAAGTVMFFEETTTSRELEAQYPSFAQNFAPWAMQSLAMAQFTIWTALAASGVGANLQHYNPLIDERVAAQWKLPATWRLDAQLVFGGKGGEAGEKTFKPIEERVVVHGA